MAPTGLLTGTFSAKCAIKRSAFGLAISHFVKFLTFSNEKVPRVARSGYGLKNLGFFGCIVLKCIHDLSNAQGIKLVYVHFCRRRH